MINRPGIKDVGSLTPDECAVKLFDLPDKACQVIQERGDTKCLKCERRNDDVAA